MEDTAQKSHGSDEFILQLEQSEEEPMSGAIAVLDQTKPLLYNQDSDCTICGDLFEQKPITVLPCGQQFCTCFIDEWFKIKQTCPFCRAGPDQDKLDDDEDNTFIDLFEELIEELGLADWNENWDLERADDNDNGDGDEPVMNHHQDTTTFSTMLSHLIRNQQENENSQTLSSFFDGLDGLFRDYSRLSQTNPVVNLQQVDQMNQQPVIPLPWYDTQLEWTTGPSVVTQEYDAVLPF